MDPTTDPLVRLLTKCLTDTGVPVAAVEDWWQRERTAKETLSDFLARQGILCPDASRTLDLIGKGYLAPSCAATLMTVEGPLLLLRALGVTASPPAVSPSARAAPRSVADTDTRPVPLRPTPPQPVVATFRPTGSSTSMPGTRSTTTPPVAPSGGAVWPPTRGAMLGKYLLTELIGKGTSGLVYRAVNQVLNLSVAIKILNVHEGADASLALEALAAEARLLASLNHPNVVRLWDFEANPATPYLVMEYVEGLSLAELISQSGRLSVERAIDFTCQIVDGLAAVWQLGIVHRDIKPHNILISREGKPKIVDLGLAVVLDGSPAALAQQAELAGTAAYMSPEQGFMSSGSIDFRSDIYSLGATLYHALTGRLPYGGTNTRELMLKHSQERPLPPHMVVSGLCEAVSNVVLTMMAREPDDRYQSATELLAALRKLAALPPEELSPPASSTATGRAPRPSGFWKRLLTGN